MNAAFLDERFDFALQLVREAGAGALDYSRHLDTLTIRSKGLQDVVSEADLNTEILIRDRLKVRFPDDAFLGEETGRDAIGPAEGIWVVDPIDGTQPFVSGLSSWCVSIAFVLRGQIEIGVVFSPVRDELFAGRRGGAATLNGQPIHVRVGARLTDGMLGVGYSTRLRPAEFLPLFTRLLEEGAMFFREGSGALMLCYVACGRLIGYVEPHINSWDCLAALAIIESAGGTRNDFLADDGLWRGNPVIAAPCGLYPELKALCDETIPPLVR